MPGWVNAVRVPILVLPWLLQVLALTLLSKLLPLLLLLDDGWAAR